MVMGKYRRNPQAPLLNIQNVCAAVGFKGSEGAITERKGKSKKEMGGFNEQLAKENDLESRSADASESIDRFALESLATDESENSGWSITQKGTSQDITK
jgi:hypothetical protein